MDCRTGDIHHFPPGDFDTVKNGYADMSDHLVEIQGDEVKKMTRMAKPRRKNYMRNKPCPCGSKKKFKKCCWRKYV